MKIGFVNVYPYRPHAHHAKYLEFLVKQLGWVSYSLNCDGIAEHCYLRELKGTGRLECAKCIAGGLRSFSFDNEDSVRKYWSKQKHDIDKESLSQLEYLVESSAYTLTRIESWQQRQSEIVEDKKQTLLPSTINFYRATLKWIEHRQLDALIIFNGRMDLTRAATKACKVSGIPFLTHERPLFGHGLILTRNDNCSSLKKIHKINQNYSTKPLTDKQCRIAAKLAAERLTDGNAFEWKLYNRNASKINRWPLSPTKLKVLVCPSSKNELLSHPDWITDWKDNTDALDMAVAKGWFDYSDLLVRFHPSWNVKFGQVSAHFCEEHYRQWCEKRNVAFVESSSKVSTQDLIRLCDLLVVNGSTTALEAGVMGKPIICLGTSSYSYSGISADLLNVDDFNRFEFDSYISISASTLITQTLRYYYSKAAREPIFTNYIRSKTVTDCTFHEGAEPEVIKLLINDYTDGIDDTNFAAKDELERNFVNVFLSQDGDLLQDVVSLAWTGATTPEIQVERKSMYGIIDPVRNFFPKGV